MGTQRIDLLINKVRRETANEDYGANSGISDTQIVSYFNDALHMLEREINNTHASQFKKEAFIDLVANQEKYDLPDDYLASGGVVSVEYAFGDPSSTNPDWQPLRRITDLERSRGTSGEIPSAFQVVNRQLWIKSIPSTAKTNGLRVVYIKALSRFDVRRGKIDVVTLNSGASTITDLEVVLSTVTDPNEYNLNEACCVVDADGVIQMKNIKLDGSLNTSTGDVPVRSDFVYESGETIAANNYIVFGKNASTHQLDLDESVESFLTSYVCWKVMSQDSNTEAADKASEMSAVAKSIMAAYSRSNEDIVLIPEI